MPLEFALRPHFDLDRPVRRRRVVRSRFLRFAVPTAAYWLSIAGATYAFVSTVGERSPADAEARSAEGALEPPPSRVAPSPALAPPARLPEVDSTPEPAPPPPEPTPEPTPAMAPEPAVAARPAPEPDAPSVTSPFSLPGLHAEPRAPRVAASPPASSGPRAPEPFAMPDPFAMPEPFARREPSAPARNDALDEHPARVATTAAVDGRDRAQNEARAAVLPSCESAQANGNQTIEVGAAPGAPDLTRDAFASVLEDGSYLNQCAVPARTALDICAAVQNGKIVGLTVTSEPRSPTINACVRRAVTALRFPHSARLDVTRTRFAPTR